MISLIILSITAALAVHCDFMEVECGKICCGFMETCSSSGQCCKFGEQACGDQCCHKGKMCADGKTCVAANCENQHKYGCACDKSELKCTNKGTHQKCVSPNFRCASNDQQMQVSCRCSGAAYLVDVAAGAAAQAASLAPASMAAWSESVPRRVNNNNNNHAHQPDEEDDDGVTIGASAIHMRGLQRGMVHTHVFVYAALSLITVMLLMYARHKGYFRDLVGQLLGDTDTGYDHSPFNSHGLPLDQPAYQDDD